MARFLTASRGLRGANVSRNVRRNEMKFLTHAWEMADHKTDKENLTLRPDPGLWYQAILGDLELIGRRPCLCESSDRSINWEHSPTNVIWSILWRKYWLAIKYPRWLISVIVSLSCLSLWHFSVVSLASNFVVCTRVKIFCCAISKLVCLRVFLMCCFSKKS